MLGRHRRDAAELAAENRDLRARLRDATARAEALEAGAEIRVRQYADLSDRFVALTTTACQLDTELKAARERIRALEGQLDQALGMDAPGVAAGAGWQARREDKPTPPAPASGPSGPLPVRPKPLPGRRP